MRIAVKGLCREELANVGCWKSVLCLGLEVSSRAFVPPPKTFLDPQLPEFCGHQLGGD